MITLEKKIKVKVNDWKELQREAEGIPSGSELTFNLKDGKEVTFVIGRGGDKVGCFAKKTYFHRRMNEEWTTEGGYNASDAAEYIDRELLSMFPEGLVDIMAAEEITQEIRGKKFTGSHKLWIPSLMQTFGREDDYCKEGGEQIDIFKNEIDRVRADEDGETDLWWLRSVSSANGFRCVGYNGSSNSNIAYNMVGVVLGFWLNLESE